MATKLKNLHLTKVDFVDEGANQMADIKLKKRKDPDTAGQETDGPLVDLFKRFVAWIKGEGYSLDTVEKTATTFEQHMTASSGDDINDEIWDVTYALRNAFSSILYDPELDPAGKASAMNESLSQFTGTMQEYIPTWCAGQKVNLQKGMESPDEEDLAVMQGDYGTLGKMIEKANETKGELEDMLKIDKSKMTAEERAAYEEITKKYAVEVEDPADPDDVQKGTASQAPQAEDPDLVDETAPKATVTAKSVTAGAPADPVPGSAEALIADLRAEVAKMKDDALTKELTEVTKKYEVLGKKPEDLIPTLKSLKAAGGTAYNDMIALLDEMVSTQEASGLFGEIGKSREGGNDETASVQKAYTMAAELRKSRPELTPAAALDEVLIANPELRKEFDK